MTIQAFARLCGCNPQTLRYYDRVDLLKPSRVDRFSGYRYYDEEQALLFVKIKNLQAAGFAIEEIKGLLDADDEAIYQAFDRKIAEQQARLETMKEIQRSYRSEMTTMKETIDNIRKAMTDFDPTAEFGIDRARYDDICARIDEMLTTALTSGCFAANSRMAPPESSPSPKRCRRHLVFALTPDKPNHTAFSTTVLNLLLAANPGKKRSLGCDTADTQDGQNHFWLLKRIY